MDNYEFTSKQSAKRLLGYIGDFSDDYDELINEIEPIQKAFELLRSSDKLNVLSLALDRMLMGEEFETGEQWLQEIINNRE